MGATIVTELTERVNTAVTLRIRRALTEERATLVVKNGGRMPLHLVFSETVLVGEVRAYCEGQCGWTVEGLPVSIEGKFYRPAVADAVSLAPETKRVEFGAKAPQPKPINLEFRKRTGAKG